MVAKFRFEDLFNTNKISPQDAASLSYIYGNTSDPLTNAITENYYKENSERSDNSSHELYCLIGNTLISDTLAHFAANEVLFSIDEMLVKFDVPNSVRGKFQSYYTKLIDGNKDSLLPANLDFLPKFDQFPISADELSQLLFKFFGYFAELRKLLFEKTLDLMESTANDTAKRITDAMSEIYQFYKNKPNVEFDELSEFCKKAFEKHKAPDMYNTFSIVINLFADYPFKYKIFNKFAYMKVHDPEFDDLELQRKYLIACLRTDSRYNTHKRNINSIINSYRSEMEIIERDIKKNEKEIRAKYANMDTDLSALIDELID